MERFDGVTFEDAGIRYGILQCYVPNEEMRHRGIAFHFALTIIDHNNRKLINLSGLNLKAAEEEGFWYIDSPYKEFESSTKGLKRNYACQFYPNRTDEDQVNSFNRFVNKLIPALKEAYRRFQDMKSQSEADRMQRRHIDSSFYEEEQ